MIHDPFLDDTRDPKGCAGSLLAIIIGCVVMLGPALLLVSLTHRFL